MAVREVNTNKVLLHGILANVEFDYCFNGKEYFKSSLGIKRLSEKWDDIPLSIPESLVIHPSKDNKFVKVIGEYRSSTIDGDKRKYILVKDIRFLEDDEEGCVNEATIEGYIACKPYHKVISKEEIDLTQLSIAVNRRGGVAYVPVVGWNEDALVLKDLVKGTKIRCDGRFQSRVFNNGRNFIELSITGLEVLN